MRMSSKPTYAEPAASILAALGGDIPVARALRISQSTVYRWRRADGDARHGFIPRVHHDALLRLAQARGVRLERADFVADGPIDFGSRSPMSMAG